MARAPRSKRNRGIRFLARALVLACGLALLAARHRFRDDDAGNRPSDEGAEANQTSRIVTTTRTMATRTTPPMDPRINRASSPPNAPRLTIVNHCRVAALSPSTRRLADATVRLLVLVRKSDDVTRKYVHRARARVFARAPSRSRSRWSTRTDVRSPRVSLSKPVSHSTRPPSRRRFHR